MPKISKAAAKKAVPAKNAKKTISKKAKPTKVKPAKAKKTTKTPKKPAALPKFDPREMMKTIDC